MSMFTLIEDFAVPSRKFLLALEALSTSLLNVHT